MSRAIFASMLLALAGCGADVCGGYAGKTCIALEVRAGDGQLSIDELRVSATSGFTLDDASTHLPDYTREALPLSVAILPDASFGGAFSLLARGLVGGVEIGSGVAAGTVAVGAHAHVVAVLGLSGVSLDLGEDAADAGAGDLAGDGATMQTDGATSPDLAPARPTDSECGSVANAWRQTTKQDSNCAARAVTVVESPLAQVHEVSIARSPGGRVGVVYAFPAGGPDQIELHVSTFPDASFPPTVITKTFGGDTLGDRQGIGASIAASADGTMQLCYLDASDGVQEIHYQALDAANSFSQPEVVATGQGANGHTAIAVDGAGRIVCAYHNRTDNSLKARARVGGTWQSEAGIMPGVTSSLPERGWVQLSVSGGLVQLAHHYAISDLGARPMYSSFDGTAWLTPKSIDNPGANDLNGNYGAYADVAVYGTRHAVAYFIPSASAYDLRIATFISTNDTPAYATVVSSVSTTLDYARAAMAVDPWGQLHIAYIQPGGDGMTGSLLYTRQYPDGMGGLKWLTDLVDDSAGPGGSDDAVDLAVDDHGCPHIAYFAGETGKVMYATRTDRH